MKLLKLSFITISIILNISLIFYTYKIVVPEKSLVVLEPEKSQYKKKVPYVIEKKKLEVYEIINSEDKIMDEGLIGIKKQDHDKILNSNANIKKNRFRIQIASLKDENKITKVYEKIKKEFPKYFQNKKPFIEKKYIEKKGKFYRVQSQELYNKNDAEKLCKLLASKKFNCYMVKVYVK